MNGHPPSDPRQDLPDDAPESETRGAPAHHGGRTTTIDGVKCVVVNEALKDIEPMAWDFVTNFARDNRLQYTEACILPDKG